MIISHYYKVSKYRQLRYICLSTGWGIEREGEVKSKEPGGKRVTETNNEGKEQAGGMVMYKGLDMVGVVYRLDHHDGSVIALLSVKKAKMMLQSLLHFIMKNKATQNNESSDFIQLPAFKIIHELLKSVTVQLCPFVKQEYIHMKAYVSFSVA